MSEWRGWCTGVTKQEASWNPPKSVQLSFFCVASVHFSKNCSNSSHFLPKWCSSSCFCLETWMSLADEEKSPEVCEDPREPWNPSCSPTFNTCCLSAFPKCVSGFLYIDPRLGSACWFPAGFAIFPFSLSKHSEWSYPSNQKQTVVTLHRRQQ